MLRKSMWISAICGLTLALSFAQAGDRRHGHKDLSMQTDRAMQGQGIQGQGMQGMQGFAEDREAMQGGVRGGIGISSQARDLRVDSATGVNRDVDTQQSQGIQRGNAGMRSNPGY
jgi:hypothetical protein